MKFEEMVDCSVPELLVPRLSDWERSYVLSRERRETGDETHKNLHTLLKGQGYLGFTNIVDFADQEKSFQPLEDHHPHSLETGF